MIEACDDLMICFMLCCDLIACETYLELELGLLKETSCHCSTTIVLLLNLLPAMSSDLYQ